MLSDMSSILLVTVFSNKDNTDGLSSISVYQDIYTMLLESVAVIVSLVFFDCFASVLLTWILPQWADHCRLLESCRLWVGPSAFQSRLDF